MKKSFKLYIDSLDVLDELSDEQAGQLFKAIREYEVNEVEILNGLMKAIFTPFKNNIDRAKAEYQAVCERNKHNGASEGRPNRKKPTGLESNPLKADKDKDKDKDTSVTAKASKYVYISQLQEEGIIQTERGVSLAEDFIKYRAQIKKPIKTIQPLKAYIKVLGELIAKKIDIDKAIELMKEREWQTLKAEYLPKDFGSNSITTNGEVDYLSASSRFIQPKSYKGFE